jgi:hypothetical protein
MQDRSGYLEGTGRGIREDGERFVIHYRTTETPPFVRRSRMAQRRARDVTDDTSPDVVGTHLTGGPPRSICKSRDIKSLKFHLQFCYYELVSVKLTAGQFNKAALKSFARSRL